MLKKLRDTRGEFVVSGSFKLILSMMGLVLVISVFGIVNRVSTLNTIADEAVRYIEVRGRVDSAVYSEISRLQASSKLNCDYTIEAAYMPGTDKVQFGDLVAVQLRHTDYFGIGGVIRLPVTLHSRAEGRSEQYWK